MSEIEIKDKTNAVVGKMSLPESLSLRGGDALLHESVVNFLANQRQGTHATKTKGLVSGGGKKPYKQKHTGRARAGSNRSPLWKGGGTTFGPQPRDYSYNVPKQARRAAMRYALSRKIADGEAIVVDGLKVEAPKTKVIVGLLKDLGMEGKRVLVVLAERDENVLKSARNIPAVRVKAAQDINAYDVLSHDRLLFTKDAIGKLEVEG